MRPTVRLLLVAALCFLTGCPHAPPSPLGALERAEQDASKAHPSGRVLALAGFRAWLVGQDPNLAQTRFDAAVQADPGEPYALIGQMLLARRRGHPERALEAALSLCERSPNHPLAAMAARYVLDLSGAAVPMDDAILQRGRAALSHGMNGDAAQLLRSTLATIVLQREDLTAQAQFLAEMGVPDRYTLLGPFSPYHLLAFDTAVKPEMDGSLQGPFQGPYGAIAPRVLVASDGRLNLSGERPEGDVYLLAADTEVPAGAVYAVRTVTNAAHKVYLDGTLVIDARPFERITATVQSKAVKLSAGKHRVLVKLLREDRNATLTVSLMRPDGKPAQLKFVPAQGPATAWGGVKTEALVGSYPTAEDFAKVLRPEVGDALAEFLAIRDGMARDRDGAKRMMVHLASAIQGPALTGLRADLALGDRTVPQKVARGRATRDLEATNDKDPSDVNALLERASVALDDNRLLEASELVKQARAVKGEPGYPLPLIDARIQLALNVDAQADQSALSALKIQPGLCDALALRYDVARRRDAVQLADELIRTLEQCPGHLARSAEHARSRGDLATAAKLYQQALERDTTQVTTASTLASLDVALGRFDDAVKLLRHQWDLWPRNAAVVKQLADTMELWGKPEVALKLREEALQLDGGDLQLRRSVERAKTGKELLSDLAIDGKTAIAAYESRLRREDSGSSYILDAAAVRVYPDGSMVDRIHSIQKALDASATSDIAEVNIPQGAAVLTLRTIKPDGTILEPENIANKETVSLPGVQAGDYVESEYLYAHPPRGPAQPGFTASSFYYRISGAPNHWSTYTVTAPRGTGMKVDAHNVQSEQPQVKGDQEVFFHEERDVPPYIPEPNSPPSPNEYLPFVTVGAGTTGNAGVVTAYADAFMDRGQLSVEIEQFAKEAAAGKTGLAAAQAVYAAVMQRLSGRDSGLTVGAGASLAQDRGSRLWLLKSALEAVGIRSRLAVIRTFGTDPAAYLFPNEALLPYICVRAEIPGGQPVWLDPMVRFGPFGELPQQALGGRETWLLPELGRPIEQVKSPPSHLPAGKEVALDLALSEDGKLSGSGVETYQGMEAAQLAEALESISPDQRNQALQSALSRYFGGAELSNLRLEINRAVGAPLIVRYSFVAPRFGRVEGSRIVLGALTFPAQLGRRYVQLSQRQTPLFIDDTERTHTVVNLKLPPGYSLRETVAEAKAQSPFGNFVRHETAKPGVLTVDEAYRLDMARIPPEQYEQFAQFAGEVDLIQSRDLLVEKK